MLSSPHFLLIFRRHGRHLEVPNIRLNTGTNLILFYAICKPISLAISLKELASFFNYGRRQMRQIIISATGMTFKENIQKQQMSRASDLLANSNLSISNIGEQIGYQSLNNFRKIFFQHYQMTPSQYRKQKPKILCKNFTKEKTLRLWEISAFCTWFKVFLWLL